MSSTIINTPKNIRHTNASTEQKELLLQFMKKHPKLISGKFSNDFTFKDAQSLWQEIANILNSCGGGAYKDWKSWRKTWHDIRSRTKTKNSKFTNYQRGTGGGPHQGNPNTGFESEVLETIKLVCREGHTNVLESSTEFSCDYPPADSKSNIVPDVENTEENNMGVNIELPIPNEQYESLGEHENNVNSSVDPIDNSLCGNSKKNMPHRQRKKLIYASEASENYRASLEKKNKIKEDYYKKKIAILERMAIAKENSAVARERTASALEDIANNLKNFVENIN